MKNTLTLALLAAFSSMAFANTNVTLYGVVDEGVYIHKNDGAKTLVEMESGITKGSRFGIKGVEDLGKGYNVFFVLEQGFLADNGAFKEEGVQFSRDSYLGVTTPYGKFSLGRTGALASGNNGGILGQLSPFGITWKEAALYKVLAGSLASRIDNMIRYESPDLKGAKFYAQYSNGTEGDDALPNSQKDRYLALGASYRLGGLRVVAVFDTLFFNDVNYAGLKDQRTYNIGGNYDFSKVRVYAGYQHGQNVRVVRRGDLANNDPVANASAKNPEGYTTDAVTAGLNIKLWGGELKGVLGYSHGSRDYNESKADVYQLGLGYKYPISKRTYLYAGGAILHSKGEITKTSKKVTTTTIKRANTRTFFSGICHSF